MGAWGRMKQKNKTQTPEQQGMKQGRKLSLKGWCDSISQESFSGLAVMGHLCICNGWDEKMS